MPYLTAQMKLPNIRPAVVDLSDYYGIGGNILNKDLSLTDLLRGFNPPTFNDTTNDFGFGIQNNPMYLKGDNGSNRRNLNSTTYQRHSKMIYAASIDGYISPYFDSTEGVTAGKRYVTLPNGTIGEINNNGEIIYKRSSHYSHLGDYIFEIFSYIYVETDLYFYVFHHFGHVSTYNVTPTDVCYQIYRIDKESFSATILLPIGISSVSANVVTAVRFMGISDDGFHIFVSYIRNSYSNASYTRQRYHIINPINGAVSNLYSNTTNQIIHLDTNVATINAPSSMTPDLSQTGKSKWYITSLPNDATLPARIRRYDLSNPINAINTTNLPLTFTECTLVDVPVDFTIQHPANNPTSSMVELSCITLWDNNEEYLLLFSKSLLNTDSSSYNSFGIEPDKQIIYVFKVDLTDSSKLIYQSHSSFPYPGIYANIVFSEDRKLAIFFNQFSFFTMTWNSTTKTYTPGSNNHVSGLERLSLDEINQIWVNDSQNNTFIYHPTNSTRIDVYTKENIKSIQYSGTPIDITIVVNVYDFLGAKVAKNVRLVAQNCVFKSNEGTTLDITTSADADTETTITINSVGAISITPSLIEA